MGELEALDVSDETWGAKAIVMKENIEHHIGEEEGEMFRRLATSSTPRSSMTWARGWKRERPRPAGSSASRFPRRVDTASRALWLLTRTERQGPRALSFAFGRRSRLMFRPGDQLPCRRLEWRKSLRDGGLTNVRAQAAPGFVATVGEEIAVADVSRLAVSAAASDHRAPRRRLRMVTTTERRLPCTRLVEGHDRQDAHGADHEDGRFEQARGHGPMATPPC